MPYETRRRTDGRQIEPQRERFIRERERQLLTGISRTTAWRLEQQAKFPKRIQLTRNCVAWRLSEIEAWIAERIAEARQVDHAA